MSGERSPPILKYVLLSIALIAWLVSVAIFVILAPLVFEIPTPGLAVLMLGWLVANLYAADLMIKAIAPNTPPQVAHNRSVAAAALSVAAAGFALLLVFAAMSLAVVL